MAANKPPRDESATGVWPVVRRECARILARPLYPMLMAVLPLASFAIIFAIFHQRVPDALPIAFLDADRSALSRRLARMIDATRTIALARQVASLDEGERLIRGGQAYALVVAPAGLERDVLRHAAPAVVCYYNAQYLLPASIIRRDLHTTVGTLSAGIELQLRAARGEAPAAAADRLEPIRLDRHTLFDPQLSYLTFLLPPLLPTLLQIFVLMTTVLALGSELRDRTAAEWLQRSGGGIARAVAGKLLPYTANFLLVALLMLAVTFVGAGIPLAGSPLLLLGGTVLFVLAAEAVAIFLVAAFVSLRLASSAAAFFSGPAFAFSGVTFPSAAMPWLGRAWGALIPLTHYVRLFVEQALRGAPPAASFGTLAALAALVLVFPVVSLPRLARLARDARFWGRP